MNSKVLKFDDSPERLMEMAVEDFDDGYDMSAVKKLLRVLEKQPENKKAAMLLSGIYQSLGYPEYAKDVCFRLLLGGVADDEVYFNLAVAILLTSSGDGLSARQNALIASNYYIQKAFQGAPEQLKKFFTDQLASDAARPELYLAKPISDRRADILLKKASEYLNKGDVQSAAEIYGIFKSDIPKQQSVFSRLALHYAEKGDYDAAFREAGQALSLKPDDIEALDVMRLVLRQQEKDCSEAVGKLMSIEPSDAYEARKLMIIAGQENLHDRVLYYSDILLDYRRSVKEALVYYAVALHNSGKKEEAREQLKSAMLVFYADDGIKMYVEAAKTADVLDYGRWPATSFVLKKLILTSGVSSVLPAGGERMADLYWGLRNMTPEETEDYAYSLAVTAPKTALALFGRALTDTFTDDLSKRIILFYYLDILPSGYLQIVSGDILKRCFLTKNNLKNLPKAYYEAYKLAFTEAAFNNEIYVNVKSYSLLIKKLINRCERLYAIHGQKGLPAIRNKQLMAKAMLYMALRGEESIGSEMAARARKAAGETFGKYVKILEEADGDYEYC